MSKTQTATLKYVNEDEKFWKHSYRVHLNEFDTDGILINADNEGDALDYAVDYHEEQGHEGLFYSREELEQMDEAELDEITFAGNHGRAINSIYLQIVKID